MTPVEHLDPPVAMVGLGIMGGALSRHLLASGRTVLGFDPDAGASARFASDGGSPVPALSAIAGQARVIFTSLPSAQALQATVDALCAAPDLPAGQCVVELSTLSLADKLHARERLAVHGVDMLDAPLSGTGAQAALRDLGVYASGDRARYDEVEPLLRAFAQRPFHVGEFGNGTRMKLAANLLVAIHNVAAAEALHFAQRCGVDAALAVELLGQGAGASRMFELRAPLMVRQAYEPATMKLDIWQKDLSLIREEARSVSAATPMLDATLPLYAEALRAGPARDTAAVFEVFRGSVQRPS